LGSHATLPLPHSSLWAYWWFFSLLIIAGFATRLLLYWTDARSLVSRAVRLWLLSWTHRLCLIHSRNNLIRSGIGRSWRWVFLLILSRFPRLTLSNIALVSFDIIICLVFQGVIDGSHIIWVELVSEFRIQVLVALLLVVVFIIFFGNLIHFLA